MRETGPIDRTPGTPGSDKNVDFVLKIYISDRCSTTVLKKWDVWIDEMDQGVGEVMGKHRADAEHIYCQSAPQYLRVHSGVLGR